MLLSVVTLILLLAMSAVFSATETAFTSIPAHEVEVLSETRGRRGKRVKLLLERPALLLTTILVGNNLANIGAAAVVTLVTEHLFGAHLVSVASGLLTLVVLIFCEVTPKRIAIAHNTAVAMAAAYPLTWLGTALRPVILLITWVSSFITRFFTGGAGRQVSQDAILSLIAAGENEGIVKKYEGRMMRGVFHLDDIPVQTIMTPRNDVYSLHRGSALSEVIDELIRRGFSRIPVHDADEEHIVGILLVKDVVQVLSDGKPDTRVMDIMKRPIFVPETWKLNDLFALFQRERLKMAVVIDQHGGLAGVVTVEDIAEEIFGEIFDETDPGRYDVIKRVSDGEYRIAADTSLPMVESALGIALPDGRPDQTLGAYVLDTLEHIPRRGETFTVGDYRLTVEGLSRHRLRWIRLHVT